MNKQYVFWFNMRKYAVDVPSMLCGDMVKLADANPFSHVFRDVFREPHEDIGIGHGESVDLTGEPHFYTLLPATTHRGVGE